MRKTLVRVVYVVWVLLFANVGHGADWPQWRGPNRDGVSAELLNITNWPPTVIWSNTIAKGESSMAVNEGRLYTMGRTGADNFVYCLDANTGSNIWTQSYAAGAGYGTYGPQSTPTVYGNEVYTFDDTGELYCFNKITGAILWHTTVNLAKPPYGYAGSPLVEGDKIFLNASGVGAAVSRTTHAVVWPTGTPPTGTGYSSPVGMTVAGQRMILIQTDAALKAINPLNGNVLWSYLYDPAMVSGYAAADPVVYGDKILLYENGLVLLQAGTNTVTEVYPLNTELAGAGFSTPVVGDDYAYGINSAGELVRICVTNGVVDWNTPISDYVQGAIVAVDGKLVVLADGKLQVVEIGEDRFDQGVRLPVRVSETDFGNYGWTPPAISGSKIYCRIGATLVCYEAIELLPSASISMDTKELDVLCPQGSVVTQEVEIGNCGEVALTWSLSDSFEGTNFTRIARQFKVPWSTPYALKYDATRDCLWASDLGATVAQLNTANGNLLNTKDMGTNVSSCYAIELEGGNLWGLNNSSKKFVKFNLNDTSVLQRVSFPSGWSDVSTMAKGDGKLFASPSSNTNVYRLDSSSGAIQQTFGTPDTFSYTRHIGYASGCLWWGVGSTPYNRLVRFDPATGKIRSQMTVAGWQTGCSVYDVSASGTNSQLWTLTYRHQTNLYEQWAHLVDLSGTQRLTESPASGTVPPGEVRTLTLVFDGRGATPGLWPVRLAIASNGGAVQEKLVTFVVYVPGVNHAPFAEAGANQIKDATGVTTPVTLNGSGSDPDGDPLRYTWTDNGTVLTNSPNPNPTVNLLPGIHDILLTVDDYRGGTATDTVRITINAPAFELNKDFVAFGCPTGQVATASIVVSNQGLAVLNWSVELSSAMGLVSTVREFVETNDIYYMSYDKSQDAIWMIGRRYTSPNTTAYYWRKRAASDGQVLIAVSDIATNGSPYNNVNSFAMESNRLWISDYNRGFRRFDSTSLAEILPIIPHPTGWDKANALAIGENAIFATTGWSATSNVYLLGKTTGQITSQYVLPDIFASSTPLTCANGKLWRVPEFADKSVVSLQQIDAMTGKYLQTIDTDLAKANVKVKNISVGADDKQLWMYSLKNNNTTKSIALLDLSKAMSLSVAPLNGAVAVGGNQTVTITMDGRIVPPGVYQAVLHFYTTDPLKPKVEVPVMVIVYRPSDNHEPVANAGPDRTVQAPVGCDSTVVFLDASGSSDSDNDFLMYEWRDNGVYIASGMNPLAELGLGTHPITLTVSDLKGGIGSTDVVQITVTNSVSNDFAQWYGPGGVGRTYETNVNWIQNWPPIVAWRRPEITGGGYRSNNSPIVNEGRVYYCGMWCGLVCLDAVTGQQIWGYGFRGGNPTPCVDGDRVYAATYGGDLVGCWNKYTGSNIWMSSFRPYSDGADGSGCSQSGALLGDLLLHLPFALNKYTGKVVWQSNAWHPTHLAKGHTWKGKTYIANGYGDRFLNPLTGREVRSGINGSYGAADGTVFYGNDMTWGVDYIATIGGGNTIVSGATPGESYHQPIVVDDYGYFIKGAHGAGGTVCGVDLKAAKQVWQGRRWGTFIAVGDRLVAHRSGEVGIIKCGVPTYVEEFPAYRYDQSGANDFTLPAYANQRIYIMANGGLTCLYTGLSAPAIENRAGEWDWSTKSAKMCGNFVNTGGKNPVQGYAYWGRTDGGTNAAQWEHCTALGSMTVGAFSKSVSEVPTDTVVYYRCYAENSQGGTWASGPSIQVSTFRPQTVEGEDGLLLHWRLDETTGRKTVDDSPYHHTGVLRTQFVGTEWTPGKIGNGLSFPGSQNGLSPASALSKPLEDNWTVGLWVKTEYNGQNANVNFLSLTERYTESVEGGMKLRGYFWGGVFRLEAGTVVGSSKTLSDGQWHHAGIVREGNVIRLYIDGKPDGTVTSQNTFYRFVNIGQLGNDTSHANGTGGVAVDDLRVYTRTFSPVEMAALVAAGGGTHSATQTVVAAGSDDAEETSSGTVIVNGTGLNLGVDGSGDARIVGVRFPNVAVPRGATIDGAYIQFTAGDVPTGVRRILNQGSLVPYGWEDGGGTATVSDGGVTIKLTGNAWKAHPIPAYTVTSNTMLTVDFSSTWQCEIHGIGLDSSTSGNYAHFFKLWGWENSWSYIRTYETYNYYLPGTVVRYDIPVGTFYTGVMSNLVFVNDSHPPRTTNGSFSVFSNIRLYENGTGQNETTVLGIFGEAVDSATVFNTTARNLSARTRTRTAVPWVPEGWLPGDVGLKQLTPNVGSVVQGIVDRPGWNSGNAMVFLIQGRGRRVADAFERGLNSAARLQIHWSDVTDVDGDGLPDIWERSVVGKAASAVDLLGDDDGDGIQNIYEYWAGTDGGSASSVLAAQTRTTSDGKVVVCFDVIPAGGLGFEGLKRYYSLQRTDNLTVGPWTNVIGYAHILATETRQVAYTNNNDCDEKGYYRIKVNLSDGHQPQVEVVAPIDGTIVPSGSNVVLWADAWDPDGSIERVEFYSETTKIGETAVAPYVCVWTNPTAGVYHLLDGIYEIRAVTRDNVGNMVTSASLDVQIGTHVEGFVGMNTTAQGTWKGVFGGDGCVVVGNGQILPAWATVTVAGKSDYTWNGSTTDGRALQKATPTNATDRVAACWYSSGSFTVDVGISDGGYHTISFYCLDWDPNGRRQKVEVFDKASGALLDTRILDSSYASGVYLTWMYKRNVQFKFTCTAGVNAVVSGVFFGFP